MKYKNPVRAADVQSSWCGGGHCRRADRGLKKRWVWRQWRGGGKYVVNDEAKERADKCLKKQYVRLDDRGQDGDGRWHRRHGRLMAARATRTTSRTTHRPSLSYPVRTASGSRPVKVASIMSVRSRNHISTSTVATPRKAVTPPTVVRQHRCRALRLRTPRCRRDARRRRDR